MPEEDDDALGQMLGDRLKGAKAGAADASSDEPAVEQAPEAATTDETRQDDSEGTTDTTNNTKSAQITESTKSTSTSSESETESGASEDTVRSRSPFPLYVTPELKGRVQNRFEKFNAQRTLNDEPQVEKHKHFMEGLLRAGLDHPELEEYVLEEFDD
jgi:hypothetical protein